MASTILVTGSTGTVGTEVVKQLAAAGVTVRAAVQATSKTEKIRRTGAVPVVMNFDDAGSIKAALDGIDRAFLITPVVPDQAVPSRQFLEAAKQTGLKHLVRLSVLGVESGLDYAFGRQLRQSEQEIRESGIAYTFVRPNFFMQNFLGYESIKTQAAFYDSAGDSRASTVDARDIAAVAAALLTQPGHEGKAYDVTGPQSLSNFEMAEVLSSVAGRKISYVPVSDEDARKSMQAANMPGWLINALIELIMIKRAGATAAVSPDVERLIGRKPISFEQFARDHVEAFS